MDSYDKIIEDLLTTDSFVRWIEGKASAAEALRWEVWLQKDPIHKNLVDEAKAIHTSVRFKPGNRLDLEAERSRLHRSIDEFESLKKPKIPPMATFGRRGYFMHAAAVILLLLTVLTVFQMTLSNLLYSGSVVHRSEDSAFVAIHTEYGQKKILSLSDGSSIVLNANSSLKYPLKDSGSDFTVRLEGEAYFDIARKTGSGQRVFTVHTPDGNVTVLGTKFNVNTYRVGTEVILEEGSIRVELRDTQDQLRAAHTMEPGELSRFVSSGRSIEVHNVRPELYTSWTQNKFIFDRTPLIQIVEQIEDIYGVRFPLSDPELQQTAVSGSIPSDNLPVLLTALGKLLERSVTNENGTIHLGPSRVEHSEE